MTFSTLKTRKTEFGVDITYPNDEIIGKHLNETGYWEKDLSEFLIPYLLQKDLSYSVVLDIGAHVGYFSLLFWYCSQHDIMCPAGQIHSFEPCKDLYEILQKNTIDKDNIITHNYGIHTGIQEDNKYTKIYRSKENTGDNSFDLNEAIKWNGENFYTDYCFVKSILGFDINFDKISVVKIDTQGTELKLLNRIQSFCPKETTFIVEKCDGLEDYIKAMQAYIIYQTEYDIVFVK